MVYIKKNEESEFINKNNHFILNDLLEIHHAVQMEQVKVKKGDLSVIKLLIMKRTLLELWLAFLVVFPHVALIKVIFSIEVTFFMSWFVFLAIVFLFYYFNSSTIKKVKIETYLERLAYLQDKTVQGISSIEFAKKNAFVSSDIKAMLLIDPEISIVKLKNIPSVSRFLKFELIKYILMTSFYFSFVGVSLWILIHI